MDKTIIYLTDNLIDERLFKFCQKNILNSIGDRPLISVSQEPIDFGKNICVGKIGRSSLTICKQMMAALDVIETPFVAMAEHDCLYSPEHFNFIPKDRENFFYNDNVWFLQYDHPNHQIIGLFSKFHNRKANSQLICATDLLRQATQDRMDMMGDPAWLSRYPTGRIGEPGAMQLDHAIRLSVGKSLQPVRKKLIEYVGKYTGVNWKSRIPNLDIRHGLNFTGHRRGRYHTRELAPWGTMEDVFNAL